MNTTARALYLAEQWNEGFNLQYLGGLLHQDVVVLKSRLYEIASFQRRVRTSHRDDLGLFDQ